MIDYKQELVALLDNILPTYYELFVDSSTKTPCITYIELDNSAEEEGDTIGYSHITYQVKIWGYDIQELSQYANEVDVVMKNAGFKRLAKNELWYNEMGQLILKYRALALENF